MATCPKRGVLNAGDRPGRIAAAVEKLTAAAQPFKPRVMPIAQRRAVPMSTPMRAGSSVPLGPIGLGALPPGAAVRGNMPGLGNPGMIGGVPSGSMGGLGSNGGGAYNPGTSPITHGSLGPGGTSTGFGPMGGPLGANGIAGGPMGPISALVPFITAVTDWAREVSDAITAITDTISADGMAVLWAVDQYLGPYTEPLQIWRPEWRSYAVFAGRIQDARTLQATVLAGAAVHWDPHPNGETITVKSIDGMSPNDGHDYLITFLYFGVG